MQNPRARNSKRARNFFRFTRATFIVARDFFAKSWKLFCKIDKRVSNHSARPAPLSGPSTNLSNEASP